ncbi:probable magnesium transporter NIPA8 isoform X2 [Syzygium oleosum]|uniref:probable magnesium transporter NIPA8 isoform X2 n=1 Tax=Syzygium oleosum TaxID=219896 RepID=UPI0024BB7D65|nr:probable magnesium transporter NIPA8 isoform X2 [Syzygium oleosum]
MGEWVIGAFINLFGSIAINFGTNLLKLGHNERERQSLQDMDGANGKLPLKPIIHFHTWRVGILFFFLGNCLNFISFGYAAQSLLAALGSVQFVSNIAFAYFVLNKMVTVKVLVATAFIVLGNIFLVAFGNHQSPVYTPEQLAEKYSNITFLFYCVILVLIVALHHAVYRRGELLIAVAGQELRPYWHMLLPFSYAIVSGAVGSCSVLFAKSLSNLLRLAMSSSYQLHSWFTYSMLLLFLSTAGFWMTRLNEGLSLFDAILIVPMFQIAWTFFSICTGFVYFQEYQVFDALRTTMFILGMTAVFVGISLLAPDESRGGEVKDNPSLASVTSSGVSSEADRLIVSSGDGHSKEMRSFMQEMTFRIMDILVRAKNACSVSLGFTDDSINASAVLVMPMVSSKITGFRSTGFDRSKVLSMKNFGWSRISLDEEGAKMMDTAVVLP